VSERNLPTLVEQKLRRLAQVLGVPFESIVADYWDWYDKIAQDPQFTNDEERHAYAIRSFWAMRVARPPTREVYFIPIGYTEARKTRSTGESMCRIYGIYSEDGQKWEKATLIGRGTEAEIWREAELFTKYKIRVSMGRGGMLWAVPETTFENGTPLPLDVNGKIEFLKKIGIKVFQLKDVYKNLSRTDESGKFVDEWDLKGLYAIVVDYKAGVRSDGSKWAFYIVSDDSVDPENNIDEEGNELPTRFTVWVPSSMLRYGRLSDLFFYGTVVKGSDGMPFMNAIGVIPIIPKPLEG